MVNFEAASSSSFGDNWEQIFSDTEVDCGTGGINASCSRPEVADDVNSGYNVDFSGLLCWEFVSC